jgi:asparagine synthase (glutamine-hydrolysing)
MFCERMLNALALYGGDRCGRWDDRAVSIGRHLARSVPEDIYDEQPHSGPSSRYVVVGDVRLSDRDTLIADLGIGSNLAATLSDAMLAAFAIEKWHELSFDKIYGAFALAAWDKREQRLLLARDPMAQKPLFYHRGPKLVAFASMPTGLHVCADVPLEPDEDHLAEYLARSNDPETSHTFYKGIERVVPGHFCIITRNGFHNSRFWNPSLTPLLLGRHEDYVDALRSHLDSAVAAQLRGVKSEVGAHLSAGLDSSAVATTAARILAPSDKRVVAFTAVPRKGYVSDSRPDVIDDEGPLASLTAGLHPNIEHVLVRNDRFGLERIDRNYSIYVGPNVNLCNLGWVEAILDRARDRGLSIMLVGDLGNAALSDSGIALLHELFASRRFLEWCRLARRIVDRRHMRWRGALLNTFGPWIPGPTWLLTKRLSGRDQIAFQHYCPLPTKRWRTLHKRKGAKVSPDVWGRPEPNRISGTLRGLRTIDGAAPEKGSQAAWGIETRDPTADRRLIEFMLRVPAEQVIFDGEPKALIKHALADRVPREILDNRRFGRQGADWHQHLAAMRQQVSAEVDRMDEFEPARRLLDTERLKRLMKDWPASGWESEKVIASYRMALLDAIAAADFLRRATGSNL